MADPNWRIIEKVAATLEGILAPTAKVRHDIRLPVLGRPNRRPRQCDVVITYGEGLRQLLVIVEVQKRNSKPNINTFHGWLKKMEEVGALSLICVSALGYPQSIIDEVAERFNRTVKLMTLEELENAAGSGQLVMLPWMLLSTPKYKIVEVGPIRLEDPPVDMQVELQSSEKVFSVGDNTERLSLDELVTNTLNEHRSLIERDDATIDLIEISFVSEVVDIWFHNNGERFRVADWTIKIQTWIEKQQRDIPMTQFAYRQETVDGILAWIGSTTIPIQGEERNLQLAFVPDKDGLLQISVKQLP